MRDSRHVYYPHDPGAKAQAPDKIDTNNFTGNTVVYHIQRTIQHTTRSKVYGTLRRVYVQELAQRTTTYVRRVLVENEQEETPEILTYEGELLDEPEADPAAEESDDEVIDAETEEPETSEHVPRLRLVHTDEDEDEPELELPKAYRIDLPSRERISQLLLPDKGLEVRQEHKQLAA